MWESNVLGTLRMTRGLLGKLIASGDGLVVNVCSVAAFEPYPAALGLSADPGGMSAHITASAVSGSTSAPPPARTASPWTTATRHPAMPGSQVMAAWSLQGRPHAGHDPSRARSISSAFASIGNPASCHARYPPFRAHAR
jgi:NAD(P)-dependent dehydrogenase (short-subunit alcohol dehydrogenase family)